MLASRAGELTSEWIPGRPRRLSRLDTGMAVALGRVLATVHRRRATASGALPGWRARATSLTGYAHGRGRDAMARAVTPGEKALVQAATACARAAAQEAPGGHHPFALLHGDLVEANVVWPSHGADPVLVDWEFWRMGDPAEDLAYLVSLNALPARVTGEVYRGYRADWPLMARVDLWTPLVLADAGLWLRAHGDPTGGGALLDRARDTLDG